MGWFAKNYWRITSRVTANILINGSPYIILFLTWFSSAETQINRWKLPSSDLRSIIVVLWCHANTYCDVIMADCYESVSKWVRCILPLLSSWLSPVNYRELFTAFSLVGMLEIIFILNRDPRLHLWNIHAASWWHWWVSARTWHNSSASAMELCLSCSHLLISSGESIFHCWIPLRASKVEFWCFLLVSTNKQIYWWFQISQCSCDTTGHSIAYVEKVKLSSKTQKHDTSVL